MRALAAALVAGALLAAPAAASAEAVTHYPVPTAGAYPLAIAAGPDGALWFTEHEAASVGRIGTDGAITEHPLQSVDSRPVEIAAGPDGALWVAVAGTDALARVETSGTVTEHPLPAGAPPVAITSGPGGLWYTRFATSGEDGSAIGRMTTAREVEEIAVPGAVPAGIAAGPDGNLWVTARAKNAILRVTPEGEVTEFALPTADAAPQGIALGPDGNLWFTERGANRVGRITPAGEIVEFPLLTASSAPTGIAAGTGGALWLTAFDGNFIARVTPEGHVEEFPPLERPVSTPNRIAAGADGAMWFTESGAGTIGRIGADAEPVPPPPPPPPPPLPPEPEPLPQPDYTPRAFRVHVAEVRLSRKGRALLRIGCPATEAEPCRGRVLLETADAISTPLGRGRFAVAAGHVKTISVKLNRKARRRVQRLRWLPVLATVSVTDRAGNEQAEEARFRLLAPKPLARGRRNRN